MKTYLNGFKIEFFIFLIVLVVATIGCSRTVATVNGEKITQAELNQRLMQEAGKEVLDQMITEKLILQEAKKKGIKVSEEEIDKKIEEFKKQFPDEKTFRAQLKENNMTIDFLREQLKLQLIVEKILKDKIKVSEEDVKKYYEENKEMFFPDKKFEEVKKQIEEELQYQKLSMQTQIWIEELKKKAKIVNTLEEK
jgi:foldase protein PrsA